MTQRLGQRIARRPLWSFANSENIRNCLREQIRRRHGCEIDQPHTVSKIVHDACREPHRQTRFSHTAWAHRTQTTAA